MKYSEEEYRRAAADLHKNFDYLFKDFGKCCDETAEDFSRRVIKQKAVEMRVIRRLWIVDTNGIVTLTKIIVPPTKKTLIQKIKGWLKREG